MRITNSNEFSATQERRKSEIPLFAKEDRVQHRKGGRMGTVKAAHFYSERWFVMVLFDGCRRQERCVGSELRKADALF